MKMVLIRMAGACYRDLLIAKADSLLSFCKLASNKCLDVVGSFESNDMIYANHIPMKYFQMTIIVYFADIAFIFKLFELLHGLKPFLIPAFNLRVIPMHALPHHLVM